MGYANRGAELASAFSLIATLLLAACDTAKSDVEAGPIILQCDGNASTKLFTEQSQADRNTYRIDGKASTFEVYNEEKQEFTPWGVGKLTVTPAEIKYDGTLTTTDRTVSAVRFLKIDRATGTIRDAVSVSIGGQNTFDGTCKTVSRPEIQQKRF